MRATARVSIFEAQRYPLGSEHEHRIEVRSMRGLSIVCLNSWNLSTRHHHHINWSVQTEPWQHAVFQRPNIRVCSMTTSSEVNHRARSRMPRHKSVFSLWCQTSQLHDIKLLSTAQLPSCKSSHLELPALQFPIPCMPCSSLSTHILNLCVVFGVELSISEADMRQGDQDDFSHAWVFVISSIYATHQALI